MDQVIVSEGQRRRGVRKPGSVRRQEILAAAAAILREQGPSGLTLERVAQQVGIGKTTVYLYYPSRETLLRAASERLLTDCLEAADRAGQVECPTRSVHQFCRELFATARDLPPELIAGVAGDAGFEPIDLFHAREFCGSLVERLAVLFERLGPPPVGARVAARTLVAAVLTQAQWGRRAEHSALLFGACDVDPIEATVRALGVA